MADRQLTGARPESASADSGRAKIPEGGRFAAAALASDIKPLAATGILLLGGASERFGSPKALAPFRGETLAERAWRVLGEVCDEVIAVGKNADELALPFPVTDDDSNERAPVFGVMAGLRAASHELCLMLPVDCPLVTADALRALAEAQAVPHTGPLPGTYSKAILPDLESRIATGELSLRGVNAAVLDVDERLFANVNTRMDLIEAAVADWARERDDVCAAIVVGSQVRTDSTADRWSDLDIILIVDDPESYAESAAWISEFGTPALTFLEETPLGQRERRVLYETGEDVDLPLLPLSAIELLEQSANAAALLARGYRLLVDKIGLEERLRTLVESAPVPTRPSQADFDQLVADFWYHALWTAKKLRRGEVFTAIDCLDGYMKARLVTLLEWHARAIDPSVDTWHAGRFLERWADPGALAALERAYAYYAVRDVARALWETTDLFQGLEEETARRLELTIELDHADLRRRVAEVVPDPRHTSTLWP
ncbi:MAG TPA: aminoglycoside 6-adenylyltransferase [Gaiellaceae bacterium]|nr:aminoglycoside 6-adenylyltransferase [Gaiellaceae bacterium]